jgi:hypothetical protein
MVIRYASGASDKEVASVPGVSTLVMTAAIVLTT